MSERVPKQLNYNQIQQFITGYKQSLPNDLYEKVKPIAKEMREALLEDEYNKLTEVHASRLLHEGCSVRETANHLNISASKVQRIKSKIE